jgi:hypothetical protein
MKKNLVLPVLLGSLLAVMVLGGCASAKPLVWDEALPESEMASVYWYWGILPTSYNGVAIKPGEYKGKFYNPWQMHSVQIPAGDAEVVMDVSWIGGYVSWSGKDFIFKYNFEAGKQYVIAFSLTADFKKLEKDETNEWGVGVYEQAPPKVLSSLGMGTQNLIEFVPFVNQPTEVTTTYR